MNTTLQIARFLLCLDQVDGRKKLQKITHILQECGVPFDVEFDFSHYGPYSPDLKAYVDELVVAGFVFERRVGKTYQFSPSKKLVTLIKEIRVPPVKRRFRDLAKSLNRKDAQDLEGISTIMFLQSRKWNQSAVTERFRTLKPHLAANVKTYISEAAKIRSVANA